MQIFPDLLRHNAWANRTVVDSFATAPENLETIGYDGDPLRKRLQHQLGTESLFLGVFRSAKGSKPGEDLPAMTAYAAEIAVGLESFVSEEGEAGLEKAYFVPWFNASLPMHVLVSQVLGHSSQHRSELAWELARAGVNTGALDYIVWVAGGRPKPGEKPVFPGR